MKNEKIKLLLLGLTILTVGFISCEADPSDLGYPEEVLANDHGNQGNHMPGDDRINQSPIKGDYAKDSDHGNQGDSKPKGDD